MNNSRLVLINYADENYRKTQRFNSWTGRHIAGFREVIEYGPQDIGEDFYKKNRLILDQKRGNGCWLWKPYFIWKTLEGLRDGDCVFYCDAGAFFCRRIDDLMRSMGTDDIWISNLPLIEKQWTKPAVFRALNADRPEIRDANQIQGGFICVKKTPHSMAFIRRWLDSCCDASLLLPPSPEEEKGECIAHRDSQSILSVLAKTEGILPHKDPTQYGRIPEKYWAADRLFQEPLHSDDYPVVLILHRTKNVRFSVAVKQWACAWLPLSIVYRISGKKKQR